MLFLQNKDTLTGNFAIKSNTKEKANMKFLKTFILIITIQFCSISSVHAIQTIYTVVLDASASLTDSEFRKQNQAAQGLLKALSKHYLSIKAKGTLPDFISIAWFGGKNEYTQLPYINVSENTKVEVISETMNNFVHPRYDNTAIYSALIKATSSTIKKEDALENKYNQIIIVVTDGRDTQSTLETEALVKRIYPNDQIVVFFIGVGVAADLAEFKFADERHYLDHFDGLFQLFQKTIGDIE